MFSQSKEKFTLKNKQKALLKTISSHNFYQCTLARGFVMIPLQAAL
jgi:hypothetical protein